MPTHELEFSTFPHGHYVDLMPFQYGRESCEPGHAFGPARRSHYLFHYIISGRGLLMTTDENGGKSDHRLSEGEGFLIFPNQVNTYVADLDDPWEYIWVEFDGIHVADELEMVGLTPSSPVYRSLSSERRARMVEEMRYLVSNRDASALHLVGHTYLFLDYLLRSVDHEPEQASSKIHGFYIREAIDFIKGNYQSDINVEEIAKRAGLNRSYFGKVFKGGTRRGLSQPAALLACVQERLRRLAARLAPSERVRVSGGPSRAVSRKVRLWHGVWRAFSKVRLWHERTSISSQNEAVAHISEKNVPQLRLWERAYGCTAGSR